MECSCVVHIIALLLVRGMYLGRRARGPDSDTQKVNDFEQQCDEQHSRAEQRSPEENEPLTAISPSLWNDTADLKRICA